MELNLKVLKGLYKIWWWWLFRDFAQSKVFALESVQFIFSVSMR